MLRASVSGRVAAMGDVPDPVFSAGMLGAGCAVWPDEDVAYAPAAGTVSAAMPHAFGIAADDGVELLVHVGIDTVEMCGEGFELLVSQGDHVEAGQPLVRFDRERVAAAGHPDCVVLAVTNSADMTCVDLLVEPGEEVFAGDEFVKCVLG